MEDHRAQFSLDSMIYLDNRIEGILLKFAEDTKLEDVNNSTKWHLIKTSAKCYTYKGENKDTKGKRFVRLPYGRKRSRCSQIKCEDHK